jgi:signal transduction histidine kinase
LKISSKIAIFYLVTTVLLTFFLSSTLYFVNQNALNKITDEHLMEDGELIKDAMEQSGGDITALTSHKMFEKYWLKITKNSHVVYESPVARIAPILSQHIADGATVTIDTKFVNFTGDFDVILRLHVKTFDDGTTIIIGLPLDHRISESYKKFAIILFATLILISVSVNFLTRSLLKPLKNISMTLRKLSEEKFYQGFAKKSNDEIGYLVEGINATFEKLRNHYAHQKNFLAVMSHELKTPLSIIKNHVEFALARDDVPIDLKGKFSNDLEQISRLNNFIHRLLLLSRLEDSAILPNFSTFDLSELLGEMTLFFGDLAEAQDKNLVCDTQQNIFIRADKELLGRAISNIIDNAIKYTPEGKSVFVSLKISDSSTVILSVRDGGESIPKEVINAAENSRFVSSQYDSDGVKNGIGLRLVIAILKLHDMAYNITRDECGNLFEIYPRLVGNSSFHGV